MISPLIYANNFIKLSLETSIPLSPMKLQKLLYLLYSRYYQLTGTPLFANNFEKWPYGPVISEVYYEFKNYKSHSINRFYRDENGNVEIANDKYQPFGNCLNDVWGRYGCCSGVQLSTLTHQPDTAWSKAGSNYFLNMEDIREDGRRFFE